METAQALYKSVQLNDQVYLDFFDQSNRYFGDYHRVCILVRATIARCGAEPVLYEKKLEQMGVETSALESVREQLCAAFLQHSAPYLLAENFAQRYLQRKKEPRLPGVWRT